MRLILLGTGAAGGVPLYGCNCSACVLARATLDSRRNPCCAVLEAGSQRLLIDAGLMDLCERFPAGSLNNVLLTHYHPDHVQGLFHLRWGTGKPIDVYGPPDSEGCADLYKNPGLLSFHRLAKFVELELCELIITPVPLIHSKPTLGFCIEYQGERVAYLTDTCGLPPATLTFLQQWQPHTVVLDCTHPPRSDAPRNHNDLTAALALHKEIGNTKLVLTHISHNFDAWLHEQPQALPDTVTLAHDGMMLDFSDA